MLSFYLCFEFRGQYTCPSTSTSISTSTSTSMNISISISIGTSTSTSTGTSTSALLPLQFLASRQGRPRNRPRGGAQGRRPRSRGALLLKGSRKGKSTTRSVSICNGSLPTTVTRASPLCRRLRGTLHYSFRFGPAVRYIHEQHLGLRMSGAICHASLPFLCA